MFKIPYSNKIEKTINQNIIIFSIIVLYQATYGSEGFESPELIKTISKTLAWQMLSLLCIAYTASKDIETSIIATTLYFIFIKGIIYIENSFKKKK